ncbi:MAG: hypothetical protein JKY54_04805 [Flavobacteriales bacterium]|nr:hypothetical protein [Flavobacteriales bacterium]
MTKLLYIIGLVCCVAMFISFVTLIEQDNSASRSSYIYDYDYDSSDSYGDYSYGGYDNAEDDERVSIATMGGLVGLLFCLYFATTYIIGIKKVKRGVAKVFNIIGLSVAGIFIFVNLIPILNAGNVYFDEFGPPWILMNMLMVPCCIVGMVQSFKYDRELKYGAPQKVRYQPQAPSYNPNHPSATAVIPGQPQYQQQQPQYQPQQPTAPPPPPPTTPPPATGGSAPIPPAPSVAPVPPIAPVDNDPIIFDEEEDNGDTKSIDDL